MSWFPLVPSATIKDYFFPIHSTGSSIAHTIFEFREFFSKDFHSRPFVFQAQDFTVARDFGRFTFQSFPFELPNSFDLKFSTNFKFFLQNQFFVDDPGSESEFNFKYFFP